jgi:hypothetical protein
MPLPQGSTFSGLTPPVIVKNNNESHREVVISQSASFAESDRLNVLLTDSTGGHNITSTAGVSFTVAPATNEKYTLQRMLMYIEDNKMNADRYGNEQFTVGINVTLENTAGVIHTFTPQKILTWSMWSIVAGVDIGVSTGVSNKTGSMRWTFSKGGMALQIDGSQGEFLNFTLGDSCTGIARQFAQVQGVKESV